MVSQVETFAPILYLFKYDHFEEAIEILQNDTQGNLNIIDVAYEVGFNNKVTFNKSFKKYYNQTPSQYLLSTQE